MSELYHKCKPTLFYDQTNNVELSIHVNTGGVMIQGPHYKDWVGREFTTLKRYVNGEPVELSDFELLWDENDSLKISIICFEKSLENTTNRLHEACESISSHKKKEYEAQLTHLERKFDSKLAVFMSAISIDIEDKIKSNPITLEERKQNTIVENRIKTSKVTKQHRRQPTNMHVFPKKTSHNGKTYIILMNIMVQQTILNDLLILQDKINATMVYK